MWLSSADDKPGLCKNAILELGRRRSTDEGYKNCTLMIDAMGIKKNIQYSQREKRFIGTLDLQNNHILDSTNK